MKNVICNPQHSLIQVHHLPTTPSCTSGSDECNKAAYTEYMQRDTKTGPQEQCRYSTEYEDKAYSSGDIATETFTFPDTGTTTSNNGNNLDVSHKNIIFGCGFKNKDVDGSSPGIVGKGGGKWRLHQAIARSKLFKKNNYIYIIRNKLTLL